MWSVEIFGTDLYHILFAFIIYSMIGWFVESVYISICNKRLTNRGFSRGPFCPIYGFGAVAGYIVLKPLAGEYIKLYLIGAIIATLFELFVAKLMIHIFGEFWWDYTNKPFNYKGMLCLESSIAWGFYALIIVGFLHNFIINLISLIPENYGLRILMIITAIFVFDFITSFLTQLGIDYKGLIKNKLEPVNANVGRYIPEPIKDIYHKVRRRGRDNESEDSSDSSYYDEYRGIIVSRFRNVRNKFKEFTSWGSKR